MSDHTIGLSKKRDVRSDEETCVLSDPLRDASLGRENGRRHAGEQFQ